MAQTKKLSHNWLRKLKNSYHDDLSQQIMTLCQGAEVENTRYAELLAALRTARQAEDTAYKRLMGRDFTSDDLAAADRLQDAYMYTVRDLLMAYLRLPETVEADAPTRRKAQELLQAYKDFNFSVSDGYTSEASKIQNMAQQWQERQQDCQALGVWAYIEKAQQAAQQVKQLSAQRAHNDSMRIKGELADARRATDAAVADMYELLNALLVVDPTDAMAQLAGDLNALQARAEKYYIGRSGKKDDDPEPEPEPEPAPDPDPEPEPEAAV